MGVRERLAEFHKGYGAMGELYPGTVGAFNKVVHEGEAAGSVDAKTKELISIGIAVYARCELCIIHHVHASYSLGATKEEILEAGLVGLVFGGGPSMTYISTVLYDSVNEFENDFKK